MPRIAHFAITKNNKQVGYAKGYAELRTQLLAHNFTGVSLPSLKRKPDSFMKGQFTISKINQVDSPLISKEFSKPLGRTNEEVSTIGDKTVIEINKSKVEDFRDFLTISRQKGLHYFIQKRLDGINKNTNAFAVVLRIAVEGVEKHFQTPFSSYNDLHRNLEKLIREIKENYNDDVEFFGLSIEYFNRPALPQSYVFGCKENDKMLKELMTKLYEKCPKNKFMKFLNKWLLISPSTYTLCVARACLLAEGGTDYKTMTSRVDNWAYRKNLTDTMTLEEKLKYISGAMKKKIHVYDDELNHNFSVEPPPTYKCDGEISILIYASHSFAMVSRKEKFNELAFTQNFTRQKKMVYVEEKELEVLRHDLCMVELLEMFDKKKNKEREESKKTLQESIKKAEKKVKIWWGSYDYETYNADSTDRRTRDVKPYAVGWTHNIGGDYKENYEYIYHDGDITLEFINKLSKIKITDTTHNHKLLLYAHNGGKFDAYEIIYKIISQTEIPIMNSLIKDGRIFQFSLKLKNGLTVEFRDSYILCAGSLDNLLKEFKCETKKLTGDIDHKTVNADNFMEIKERCLPYLQNDVLGLYELVSAMKKVYHEDYDIKLNEALTCASTARKFFINNHDFDTIPLYEIPFNQYLELKDYYYGGRCECFHIGAVEKELYYYDFTSLYPFVMAKNPFPYGTYMKKDISGLPFNKNWFGMVKCYVRTTDFNMKPYLPYKDDVGKLCFSHFKENKLLWITTEEWKYIRENNLGYEITPIEILDYGHQHTNYFKGMVDKLFQAKKDAEAEGNDARRAMSKIIVNSLYGFWGIKVSDNEQMSIQQFKNPEKKSAFINKHLCRNRLLGFEDVGKKTLVRTNEKLDAKCANIIIAQFTTAYARTELYTLMKDLEKSNGGVYYCDTDSVITDLDLSKQENESLATKYSLCVKGEKLGDLTNEAGTVEGGYKLGVFLGCKSYLLVDKQYEEKYYKKPLTYKETKRSKDWVIRKFKGINTKNIYKNKTTNDDEKTIIFTDEENYDYNDTINLYKDEGFSTLWIQDYIKMAEGYKVHTDNWNFLSGVNSLTKEQYLQFSSNSKISKCSDYSKGVVEESGKVVPLCI